MAKVLIENGLALNVLLMMTLDQLPMDKFFIRPNHMMVKPFDGATSEVVGDIDIELEIGPYVLISHFRS